MTNFTFLHELGHHVSNQVGLKGKGYAGGNRRVILNSAHHVLKMKLKDANLLGDSTNMRALVNLSVEAQDLLGDYGLRPYSIFNEAEFAADIYAVNRLNHLGWGGIAVQVEKLNELIAEVTPAFNARPYDTDQLFELDIKK